MHIPGFCVTHAKTGERFRRWFSQPFVGRRGWISGTFAVLVLQASVAGGGALQNKGYPQLPPDAQRIPDAVEQSKINEKQTAKQNFEAVNAERKRQIADDTTRLLRMALDLKLEVDKTNKDTLSLDVIRKADAIEKLARDVKEKMKVSIGSY